MRVVLACVLLLGAALPAGADKGKGKGGGPSAAAFEGVAAAWARRDAAGVVALVEAGEHARLRIRLLDVGTGELDANASRAQAHAILKGYFERVEAVSLKDVDGAEERKKTRQFEYRCRPRGKEARTTRLSFTLRQAEGGSWTLERVEERPRS